MMLAGAHEGTDEVGGSPVHYYRAGQRGTPIVLIHGLGGSAEAWGFLLPVEHPERVNQIYLLNSAGLRRAGAQSPSTPDREAARRLIKHVWGHALPVPGFILDAFVRNSQRPAYHGFIQAYDLQEDVETALAQVQVPTTIIWGKRDQLLPITCAYDFHTGIAHSKLVLLPGVGHTPQIQAVGRVARIILKEAEGKQKA